MHQVDRDLLAVPLWNRDRDDSEMVAFGCGLLGLLRSFHENVAYAT